MACLVTQDGVQTQASASVKSLSGGWKSRFVRIDAVGTGESNEGPQSRLVALWTFLLLYQKLVRSRHTFCTVKLNSERKQLASPACFIVSCDSVESLLLFWRVLQDSVWEL